MSSASAPTTTRMTTRQSEAQDRRNRMTSRRQELTNRIRKQKKSQYLAKKRNLSVTTTTSTTATTTMTTNNAPESSSSSSLFMTSSSVVVSNVKDLVLAYCRSPSNKSLLQNLHNGLKMAQPSTALKNDDNPLIFFSQQDDDINTAAIPFLRFLKQSLDGSSSNNGGSDNDDTTTTANLVLDILVCLTAISSGPKDDNFGYYGRPKTTWSILLCQDPEWLSYLVHAAEAHPSSIYVILGNLVGEDSTFVQSALRQAGVIHVLVKAIRHPVAAWALTNSIRSDTATPGAYYFSNNLLTPTLLEQILTEPAVSTQAAWMVESLTSREEETVTALVGQTQFFHTLLKCLENPSSNDQMLAIIQTLGNVASYENCATQLLLSFPQLPNLVGQCLQQQQQQRSSGNNRELVSQSAFLASCLLYGAGLPDHPSTNVAAPVLVPILFQQLDEDQYCYRSLDEKREIANALWSALDLIPEPPQYSTTTAMTTTIVPIPIPSQNDLRPSLQTLVAMLESPDADAVTATVNVLDSLLRRNDDDLRLWLEEAGIRDALEAICDSSMEEAAEVAANILDDFFYNFDDEPELEETTPSDGVGMFGVTGVGLQPEHSGGIGRGRGAVIPSWMSKSQ